MVIVVLVVLNLAAAVFALLFGRGIIYLIEWIERRHQ